MFPNDPMLRLHETHITMAERHHEASQERLASEARLVAKPDSVRTDSASSSVFPKHIQFLSLARSRRSIFFVTIVLALSALLGASSSSVPNIAGARLLAASPN